MYGGGSRCLDQTSAWGFMFNHSRKQRLVIALLLALQGCASVPTQPPPGGNILDIVAETLPPLALRMYFLEPIGSETSSAAMEIGKGTLGGVAGAIYMMGPMLPVSLILIPWGIASGTMSAIEVAACSRQLETAISDVARWTKTNRTFLENEVRSRLEARGRTSVGVMTILSGHQSLKLNQADLTNLKEFSESTGNPVLLIGSIQMVFFLDKGQHKGAEKCEVKILAEASMEARNVATIASDPILGGASISISRLGSGEDFVQRAAKDSDVAVELLKSAFRELAERIAEFYPKRGAVTSFPEQK
jgi:hypothetical protein